MEPQQIADRIGKIARQQGWKKDWANGGCYIHLEVSEFIEALRGKGKSTPETEAGDVLIAFFAVLDHYKIPVSVVLKEAAKTIKSLEEKYRI